MIQISTVVNGVGETQQTRTHEKDGPQALIILANALAYDKKGRVLYAENVDRRTAHVGAAVAIRGKHGILALVGPIDELELLIQFVKLLDEFGGAEYVAPGIICTCGISTKAPALSADVVTLIEHFESRAEIVASLATVVIYAASGVVKRTHITQAAHHASHNLGCALRMPTTN